jgi:hypothetical protein
LAFQARYDTEEACHEHLFHHNGLMVLFAKNVVVRVITLYLHVTPMNAEAAPLKANPIPQYITTMTFLHIRPTPPQMQY